MIYSIGQLQALLRSAGFPENVIVTMAAIGMAESSGNSNALNDGSGTNSVEYSVGLFQINTRVHKNYTVQQLKDPQINAREALRIYRLQGLKAWGAYTDGRYRKHLNASNLAYNSGGAVLPANQADLASSIQSAWSSPVTTAGSSSTAAYIGIGIVGLAVLYLILD